MGAVTDLPGKAAVGVERGHDALYSAGISDPAETHKSSFLSFYETFHPFLARSPRFTTVLLPGALLD